MHACVRACRGKSSGRADDNAETAWERVKIFHEQSEAPMQFLQEQECDMIHVDATLPLEDNVQKLLDLPIFRNYYDM